MADSLADQIVRKVGPAASLKLSREKSRRRSSKRILNSSCGMTKQ